MQSQSDREFQWNVMNFKKAIKGKTTWEDFEEYVGHKMDEGDKLKGFILNYFNRDFEQPYDDGQQYITTRVICTWRDASGYLKAFNRAYYRERNKELRKQHSADYRERNEDLGKQYQADYRERNKRSKKYYCELCDIACGSNKDLQQHLETKKHLRNKSRM